METLYIKAKDENDPSLEKAGRILAGGGLVAIPTETVYGLAANAFDETAAKKIYEAKGRPSDNPLIVHIASLSQWKDLVCEIPQNALELAKAYWPGPLTIILKKSSLIPNCVSGNLDTVAVRMPSNPIARAVIEKAGVPLAAPSANTSGRPSPTNAKYVKEDLDGKIDAIVDGGDCDVGVESTVITLATKVPTLLRPGAITPQMLEKVLGKIEIDKAVLEKPEENAVVASPGMKYKHYAPKTQVIIVKGSFDAYKRFLESKKEENIGALCFESEANELEKIKTVTYGREHDSHSQANRIFDALREADGLGVDVIYARFPELDGMGLAVFNRLIRAAAFNIIEV